MPTIDLHPGNTYSYADYLVWPLEEMIEIIRGKVFNMSPAPSTRHQRVSSNLHRDISQYLKGKPCRVFHAPFDVRLARPGAPEGEVLTVVQPDLCVVCDLAKLDERGCAGAPDWIIEILSPATAHKDARDKMDVYEEAGVGEYWLVHPHEQTVLVYVLDPASGQYTVGRLFAKGDVVAPVQFPGLQVALDDVFED
jgi:Uma2 family endonuclease